MDDCPTGEVDGSMLGGPLEYWDSRDGTGRSGASSSKSRSKRTSAASSTKLPLDKKGLSIISNDPATCRFHCNYCGRDLSNTTRVRCAECLDFDLCLDCFYVGVSLDFHVPTHNYRIVEHVTEPVYQMGWGADDEEKLLEALELYGVGNWEDVYKLVGGDKNAAEIERHFIATYLQSKNAPLPDMNKLLPLDKGETQKVEENVDPKAMRVMHLHQQEDIAGWMPRRGDFVYEWDNEAEEIIADMEINELDSKQERELKVRILEIYCSKLDEREARKEFIIQRNLLEFKAIQNADKKRPPEERQLKEKLQRYARWMSDQENKSYLKDLLSEKELMSKIEAQCTARTNLGLEWSKPNARVMRKGETGVSSTNLAQINPVRKSRSSLKGEGDEGGSTSNIPKIDPLGFTNVKNFIGADLLTTKELELCRVLKVTPHQYLIVKETLIRESARAGPLKRKDAKALVKLEATKVFKMYDFFAACGWISG